MELLRAPSTRHLLRARPRTAFVKNWRVSLCRAQHVAPSRFQSTATTSSKPFYVTTPIFYVNAAPHVGHLYSMVLADCLKRWRTLKGEPALFCTGTDEHGSKVHRAAAKAEMEPKAFCDMTSATFRDLAAAARLDNDFFIRTTDADHADAVRHFWTLLQERGFIYESKHAGWYCVSDECFYPESQIERRLDEFTGRVFMAATESGNEVEWIEEKNYHFRMTALRDRLLEFYENNPNWIRPASRMNQVVRWVQDNLEDLSISRPSNRLTWGIPVPGDPSQVIYVWVDALINYLTKAGYPNWAPGAESEGGWPADVHIIGKDILRFHCIYWPALLLALDLPLPKAIVSHAHWTMNHRKMSKSLGNSVNPFFAIERFGVDTMRFYLLHESKLADDSDYNNAAIVDRYKTLLQSCVGNLTARITKAKRWDVNEAVKVAHSDLGTALKANNELYHQRAASIDELGERVRLLMEDKTDPSSALRAIMQELNQLNKFIGTTEPWLLSGESERALLNENIYLAAESMRIAAILLQPFLPEKAAEVLDWFGVADEKRTFAHARLHGDSDYGPDRDALPQGKWGSIFPPLPVED